jgi:hypothetical protein
MWGGSAPQLDSGCLQAWAKLAELGHLEQSVFETGAELLFISQMDNLVVEIPRSRPRPSGHFSTGTFRPSNRFTSFHTGGTRVIEVVTFFLRTSGLSDRGNTK